MTDPLEFDFDWLLEMIVAIERGDPIDEPLRGSILHALNCYMEALNIIGLERFRGPGRPAEGISERYAELVRELVDKHGAKVNAAVAVVSPNASMNPRIERAYRTVKNRPPRTFFEAHVVAEYASKLPKKRK